MKIVPEYGREKDLIWLNNVYVIFITKKGGREENLQRRFVINMRLYMGEVKEYYGLKIILPQLCQSGPQ